MIVFATMLRPRGPVMFDFIIVELHPVLEVARCGTELCYLLDGMTLCVMLYLFFYSSVINESCINM